MKIVGSHDAVHVTIGTPRSCCRCGWTLDRGEDAIRGTHPDGEPSYRHARSCPRGKPPVETEEES